MLIVVLFGLMVCVFGAPNPDNEYLLFEPLWAESEGPGNLIEEAKKIGLNMLVEAVNAAGLGEQVMDNTLTVFAPNDEAFKRLPKHVVEHLTKNKTALVELLMYHSIPDMKVWSSSLTNEECVASSNMNMDKIRINIYASTAMKKVTVDGSRVVMADHEASNGVIHVIDNIMFPIPTMNIAEYLMHDNMYFSTLLDAVKVADVGSFLTGPGPITLFAPDNAAFKKLPAGALDVLLKDKSKLTEVLSYHVVQHTIFEQGLTPSIKTMNGRNLMVKMMGHRIMVDKAFIDYPDRKVTNGVVHVIDRVLMPPGLLEELLAPATMKDSWWESMAVLEGPGNIIQEATKLHLNTLVSLVKSTGLEDAATTNTLTVMAPTDEAFRMLPKSVLEYLGKNMTALMEVLMYHAIPDSEVKSMDIKNDELVASGDPMYDNIRFNIYKEKSGKSIITANGAEVILADNQASNGIIHVIDKLMFPVPTTNIVGWLEARREFFGTLITAAKDAGLADTLMGMGPFTLFAPDDAAFKKLTPGALDALLKDKTKLQAVLKYHVVAQTLYTRGMMDKGYMTEEGKNITIMKREAKPQETMISINGKAMVKYADMSATNGVVHVIDQVLMPPM